MRRRWSCASRGSIDGRDSTYVDLRVCAALVLAREAIERGAAEEALQFATDAQEQKHSAEEFRQEAYALCIEAATALADEGAIAQLVEFVDSLPPAEATPLLRAGRARLVAEQAHGRGDDDAAQRAEDEALALLRTVGARPLLARALLERAGRRDDPRGDGGGPADLHRARRDSQAGGDRRGSRASGPGRLTTTRDR